MSESVSKRGSVCVCVCAALPTSEQSRSSRKKVFVSVAFGSRIYLGFSSVLNCVLSGVLWVCFGCVFRCVLAVF